MTDKEKILAEIEKRLAGLSDGCVGQRYAYQTLKEFINSLPEEPAPTNQKKLWHDASETPSIFSTYLLVHDGGWCVARYFGKEVPTGNTTGWVEISKNIFVEHPQQWLDLSDLLPPKKKED